MLLKFLFFIFFFLNVVSKGNLLPFSPINISNLKRKKKSTNLFFFKEKEFFVIFIHQIRKKKVFGLFVLEQTITSIGAISQKRDFEFYF